MLVEDELLDNSPQAGGAKRQKINGFEKKVSKKWSAEVEIAVLTTFFWIF